MKTLNYFNQDYTETELAALEDQPLPIVNDPDYDGTVSPTPTEPSDSPPPEPLGDSAVALPRHVEQWLDNAFDDLDDIERWPDDGGFVLTERIPNEVEG